MESLNIFSDRCKYNDRYIKLDILMFGLEAMIIMKGTSLLDTLNISAGGHNYNDRYVIVGHPVGLVWWLQIS